MTGIEARAPGKLQQITVAIPEPTVEVINGMAFIQGATRQRIMEPFVESYGEALVPAVLEGGMIILAQLGQAEPASQYPQKQLNEILARIDRKLSGEFPLVETGKETTHNVGIRLTEKTLTTFRLIATMVGKAGVASRILPVLNGYASSKREEVAEKMTTLAQTVRADS